MTIYPDLPDDDVNQDPRVKYEERRQKDMDSLRRDAERWRASQTQRPLGCCPLCGSTKVARVYVPPAIIASIPPTPDGPWSYTKDVANNKKLGIYLLVSWGMTQTEVARLIGVTPSYVHLVYHNEHYRIHHADARRRYAKHD